MSTRNVHQQFGPVIGLCCLFVALVSTSMAQPAAPEDSAIQPFGLWRRTTAAPDGDAPPGFAETRDISLNYWTASWKRVLEDVADSAGATLVMPDLPSGRFSRRDGNKYSLADAVRILNASLESNGYRVLVKPPYLIVVEVKSIRPRYTPAAVSHSGRHPPPSDAEAGRPPGRFAQNSAGGQFSDEGVIRRLPPVATGPRSAAYGVRTVSHAEPQVVVPPATASPVDQPATLRRRVRIEGQRASAVSARMMRACQGDVTPVVERPDGFQAFRVCLASAREPASGRDALALPDTSGERATLRFVVAVDERQNELLVETRPDLTDAVTDLVRRFETRGDEPGQATRVLSTASDVRRVAHTLRRPLQQLAAAQADPPPPRGPAPAREANDVAEPPRAEVQVEPAPLRRSDLPALIEALQGDVSVEVLEDLGVLVISGNADDVRAVVQMVREIEKLGVGAAPEIHLRLLTHVNSESLAELLTGVYERVGAVAGPDRAGQSISVVPVVNPNAVLMIASPANLESLRQLADELDVPSDPRSQFQVFRLQYAAAAQVLTLLEKLYEQRAGLAARIETVVDERTNAIVVRGSRNDLAEVADLIKRIDRDESNSVSQMRLFPLENAIAEELALVIKTAIQSVLAPDSGTSPGRPGAVQPSAGQGGEAANLRQMQVAKSVVLQFLVGGDGMQRAVRSGLLHDIRVTSDPRTNSVVVTAPRQSMQLMSELIAELDKPTPVVADIKVFSLANSDAAAMVRLVEALYATQIQSPQSEVPVAGGGGAGGQLIPLRLSVDVRTNSIIAKGAPETLRVVEAILLRLDQSELRQRESTVYRLRNSPAEDVAKAINEFLTSQRDLSQIDPNLVSTAEMLEREVIVVAEPVSNSLLISSTPRYFDEIKRLAEKLDEAPAQVIIQALLVEVELDNDDEFGVELGVQSSVLFDRSVISDLVTVAETTTSANGVQTTTENIISQAAQPGFLFNNQQLGNNTAIRPNSTGGQGLSNFAVGRVNGDLGYGGLVLSAGSKSLNVLIRALSVRRNVHILSRPQIRTLDNQLAQIQVGQQVPIVDGVNISTTGATNPVVRQDQAGIILTVTPRISPDGIIVMEVIAEKSQFIKDGVPLVTDINNNILVLSPVKNITTARTTVSVPHSQTIVLGGMITETDEVTERKVPWLADIPLLGNAFRYDAAGNRRTELLIFLTPRIITNDLDSEVIKQVEAGRLHFCQQEAEEIHGPLFGMEDQPLEALPPVEGTQPLEPLLPPVPSYSE